MLAESISARRFLVVPVLAASVFAFEPGWPRDLIIGSIAAMATGELLLFCTAKCIARSRK